MIDKKIFLDVKTILEKDKLVNMIAGARGIGKTYSALKYAYDKFYEKGTSSVYLRRYKTELKKFRTIFNPLIQNGDVDENKAQIDQYGRQLIDIDTGKTICEAIALSTATNLKSASFNTCDLIIFDEFILDKGSIHYIQDEFEIFNNFIETISRLGELTENRVVKILMLANAGSRNNPYFSGYNVPIMKTDTFINNDMLVTFPNSEQFKKIKEKTRWGSFINKNTKMTGYMLDGSFKDKNDFIEGLPPKTSYVATLKYLDKKIGMFVDYKSSKLYLSNKVNENNTLTYALTKEDSTPNYLILTKANKLFQMLKQYWEVGQLRFSDLKIQMIFLDILKLL